MTPQLCKAARALIEWTAADLSESSGVSSDTIRSFESGRSRSLRGDNDAAVRAAFAREGVRFLDSGETAEGIGVVRKTP
ncbi:helix-turn-helix transcriptional regulator [Histidinibacterium aquaticum]|uniref:Helix-turn-helix transcriptional regulator n=1 Tax=Histidinibacterium aquaticum TaxID=2613962 RepID=A0A5J5GR21_9RHOB|nr:helix-turn-helix transcriptional regulator [Histidinibacterium aquaticum]